MDLWILGSGTNGLDRVFAAAARTFEFRSALAKPRRELFLHARQLALSKQYVLLAAGLLAPIR